MANGYLLDTHVLLWLDTELSRIPSHVLEVLADRREEVYVSAASTWELAIKISLGKLTLKGTLGELQARHRFEELPVMTKYAEIVAELPHHHGDPFDRLLVAQARSESLVLVTADQRLRAYSVPLLLL